MADDIGKTLVQRALDWGATNLRIEQGGKHPRLVGDYKGVAFMLVFSGNTGDRRAVLNCLSDLRRVVGIEREVTAAPFPQKRKRHRIKSKPHALPSPAAANLGEDRFHARLAQIKGAMVLTPATKPVAENDFPTPLRTPFLGWRERFQRM